MNFVQEMLNLSSAEGKNTKKILLTALAKECCIQNEARAVELLLQNGADVCFYDLDIPGHPCALKNAISHHAADVLVAILKSDIPDFKKKIINQNLATFYADCFAQMQPPSKIEFGDAVRAKKVIFDHLSQLKDPWWLRLDLKSAADNFFALRSTHTLTPAHHDFVDFLKFSLKKSQNCTSVSSQINYIWSGLATSESQESWPLLEKLSACLVDHAEAASTLASFIRRHMKYRDFREIHENYAHGIDLLVQSAPDAYQIAKKLQSIPGVLEKTRTVKPLMEKKAILSVTSPLSSKSSRAPRRKM